MDKSSYPAVAECQDISVLYDSDTTLIMGATTKQPASSREISSTVNALSRKNLNIYYRDPNGNYCQVLMNRGQFDGYRYCSESQQRWLSTIYTTHCVTPN